MLVEQVAMKVEQSPKAGPQERKDVVCEGQQKAQPASSELEVNAVSACQAAGHESRAESQSGAPVQDSHAKKVRCTRRAREASSDFRAASTER